ncbi:hypothetical protein [Chitinimonas sp.]|uniref:hypothetical protein n=1 Tax=Chitinimonas sp. TaxID=1934313 RepID=UPI0035AF3C31
MDSRTLDRISTSVGRLSPGVTEGNQITLSEDGAGWGWHVDPNPLDSSEFLPTASATEFKAADGSPAAGKLDLLIVLIHELGHVLGMPDTASADDSMGGYLTPGLRRLPDAISRPCRRI